VKVLVISASPHREKSKTFLLTQHLLSGLAQEETKLEIVHLADCTINFCRHCEVCHRQILSCPLHDSVGDVLLKMLEADGIIMATPNYINQVTGSLKALFDRSAHFIHCKRLLGKYIAGVVTSGSGRDEDVLGYIKYYGHTCGAQYVGGVSAPASCVQERIEQARDLGNTLAQDIQNKKVYSEQIAQIEKGREHFQKIIQLRKDHWQGEYAYWHSQGWL